MAKTIHGTVAECVKRLAADNGFKNAGKEECATRNKVCELLGIGTEAGHAWFDDMVMPKGVNMLKLQVFLDILGYSTVERTSLNDLQQRIGTCLALSQATPKDLGEFVGANEGTILRWAFGGSQPLPDKVPVVVEVIKLYEREMDKGLIFWQKTIEEIGLKSIHDRPTHSESTGVSADNIVWRVAQLVKELEPLAKRLASDEFTVADRLKLRELTALEGHSHSVFELMKHLKSLCGEKARNELR